MAEGRTTRRARAAAALRRRAIERFPRLCLRALALRGAELGLLGEELAARHLAARGWRLLGRRLATPRGEVDLVAERGGLRACFEVKTGRLPDGCAPLDPRGPPARFRPGQRVDARQLARLRRAARYLARGGAPLRVDLIEVLVAATGAQVLIVHHEDLQRPLA